MIRPFARRLGAVGALLIVQFVNLSVVPVNARAATAMSPQELKAHCEEFTRKFSRLLDQQHSIERTLDRTLTGDLRGSGMRLRERLELDERAAQQYFADHLEASPVLQSKVLEDRRELANDNKRSHDLIARRSEVIHEYDNLRAQYPDCNPSRLVTPDPCASPTVFLHHRQPARRLTRYDCGKAQRKAAASRGSFARVDSLTEVSNVQPREFTVDAAGGSADWNACCDGATWKVHYTFRVPATLTPGQKSPIAIGAQILEVKPDQPLQVGIVARAPGFNKQLLVDYPNPGSGSRTYELPISASETGSKEILITIDMPKATVTSHYRRRE